MDSSGEDGECQVEAVITPQSKKGKRGRLPFQTPSTDSPKDHKKRKSVVSPDCRTAQHAKVNTKENSFKKSGKTEDIVVIAEEKKGKNDSTTVKGTSKLEEKTNTDSPKKKKSSGRGPGKHRNSESKVAVNPLTKFFKKMDSKDSENEAQSPSSKNNEEKTEKSVETESKDDSAIENVEEEYENGDITVTKKDEEHHSDSEDDVVELHKTSSSKANETVDTSHLNETDNVDVDSDPNSDLDDSHDNDDDSHKSDTDCKKTEHGDTDNKDDTSRGESRRHITLAKNKLLDSKGKERKLTPKQLGKKLEIQKKREMRDKHRQERENKLQEERESRKHEKEEKQLEQNESSYGDACNYGKKTGALKKFSQQIFQKGGSKKSMMPNSTASTSNLVLNEIKSDGCGELVDDVVVMKFDVNGDWELLNRALKFGSDTFTPLIILFKTNLSARLNSFSKYFTQDGINYRVFYANQVRNNSSEVLVLANKHDDVKLKVTYLSSDNSNLPLINHFIALKVKLDKKTKFNLIAIDICSRIHSINMKAYGYIATMIDVPTMLFINYHQEETPNNIEELTNQFELKKKIIYQGSNNSMTSTFFYMSKTHPVGLEKINTIAPWLKSPTCMVVKRDKESE